MKYRIIEYKSDNIKLISKINFSCFNSSGTYYVQKNFESIKDSLHESDLHNIIDIHCEEVETSSTPKWFRIHIKLTQYNCSFSLDYDIDSHKFNLIENLTMTNLPIELKNIIDSLDKTDRNQLINWILNNY